MFHLLILAVPDLAFIHQDGSRQDLGDYIQDIIRGAQEKASEPEMAPLATAENSMQEDVTLTQSYYTDDSPSKESHNVRWFVNIELAHAIVFNYTRIKSLIMVVATPCLVLSILM